MLLGNEAFVTRAGLYVVIVQLIEHREETGRKGGVEEGRGGGEKDGGERCKSEAGR